MFLIRCIDGKGQHPDKFRPHAQLTFNTDTAVHKLHQSLHNGKPQACALQLPVFVLVFLRKSLEGMLLKIFTHADPRIFYHKFTGNRILCLFQDVCRHLYSAVRFVVFDGITDDIHEDLPQMQRTGKYPGRIKLTKAGGIQRDPLLVGPGFQYISAVINELSEINGFLHQIYLSGFQLTHIQYIIDQRQQIV